MKNSNLLFFLFFISSVAFAQAPEGINYQAVIRNLNGTLVTGTNIALRIQIKQSTTSGLIVFQERHTVQTSQQGLINLVIGNGTVISGNFSTINWGNGPYFIALGVDFSAGTNYLDYGIQQMMSVPYALFAKTSGTELNQWQYGIGIPVNTLGTTGDYYYDTQSGNIYYKNNGTNWLLTGNITGPQGPIGLTGAIGATGPQGPIGLTGPTGATGPQGPIGANGTNGNTVLNGTTVPNSATGNNGDFFINTATNTLYGPKANGTWPAGTSLVGPQGSQGVQGPIGLTGATGASGPQGPIGLTGPTGVTGPQGPIGLTGLAGANGTNGTNGTAILNGTTAPTSATGINGDFFINTATNTFYGPKANGTWPAGTSLIGPQGAIGPQGPQGFQGAQGPIGLTGQAGPTGATGPQGPIGLTGPAGATGAGGIPAYTLMEINNSNATLWTSFFCINDKRTYTKVPSFQGTTYLKSTLTNNSSWANASSMEDYVISFEVLDTVNVSYNFNLGSGYWSETPDFYIDNNNINDGLGYKITAIPGNSFNSIIVTPGNTYRFQFDPFNSNTTIALTNTSTWTCGNPNVFNIQFHSRAVGQTSYSPSTVMADGSGSSRWFLLFKSETGNSTWVITD